MDVGRVAGTHASGLKRIFWQFYYQVSWVTLPGPGGWGISSQMETNKKQTVQPPEQDKQKSCIPSPPPFPRRYSRRLLTDNYRSIWSKQLARTSTLIT